MMNNEMIVNARKEYWEDLMLSPENEQLRDVVELYDYEYFDDMRLAHKAMKDTFAWVSSAIPRFDGVPDEIIDLSNNGYRFIVGSLSENTLGCVNKETGIVTIRPEYAKDKGVILHELLHVREDVLNKYLTEYRDIVFLCLYKELLNKIPDLDERILDLCVSIGSRYLHDLGGSHSILFLLKSFDLDIRCGYQLGTVFGYGIDSFDE